MPRMGTPK